MAPDVQLEQSVEELLFRAYSLYRQVDLTFESGRDRGLCLQMLYGVIAGIFKELDRARRARGEPSSARGSTTSRPPRACRGYFRRAAQRRAQLRYLAGVTGGLTVIAGVGRLLSLGLATLPDVHARRRCSSPA